MNALSLRVVKKSVCLLCLFLLPAAIFVGLGSSFALAQTLATWTGGGGEWAPCPPSGSALWSTCPTYPDGNFNAAIQGGPVTMSGGDAASVVNLSISSGSSFEIVGGYLDITGNSIANNGTITIVNGDGLHLLEQGGTVTLSGSGMVNMTSQNSFFDGTAGAAPTLVNQQTIVGQGSLGEQGFSITNQGMINASGGLLTVQPAGAGVINTGTMEASSGATLDIVFGFLGPFNNTGGTIKALDGGIVQLQGEIYSGGTLTTTGGGVIQLSGGTVLNGLTNSGSIQLSSNLGDLQNTVTNTGTITLQSGTLSMIGNATLTGSGSLIMKGPSVLNQSGSGGTLTNQQLIHGQGTIYELPLTNKGTIEADNTSAPLYLAGGTVTNSASLEASGGGILELETVVNNSGGTIEALTGSTVILTDNFGGSVNGGTLTTSGTGFIESQNGVLDGTVNVPTNAGMLTVPGTLTMQGTINNTGTIAMSGNSCIVVTQPTTLTGSGKLTMSSGNCIYGSGTPFTNQSTIEGSGTIGDSNPMPVTNDGTILANKNKASLTIVPNSAGFTNSGTLTVSKGSALIINSLEGPFNNLSGGALSDGIYNVTGMLELGSSITINAATITLTGPAAEIYDTSSKTNALAGLTANATTGALSLQSKQVLTTTTSLGNAGRTTVGASSGLTVRGRYTQTAGTTAVDGTLTASSGLNLQSGVLLGKGKLASAVTSSGTVTVGDSTTKPGVLTVTGSYAQNSSGTLNVAINGTASGSQYCQLAVLNGVSLGGTLTIKRSKSFTPAIGDTFTILTGSTVSGQFATVNGLSISGSEHFEITYSPSAVTLTVASGA
jgi:fibronectin-binding autotransporter adhesin